MATPKGASALAVVLGVVGVFLPFLTGIQTAQVFAGFASLVIVWLFWADLVGAVRGTGSPAELVAPSLSLIAIVGLATFATVRAHVDNSPQKPTAAALTTADISSLISEVVSRTQPKPAPQSQLRQLAPTIIDLRSRELAVEPPPVAHPTSTFDSDHLRRMIAVSSARTEAFSKCLKANTGVSLGLFALRAEAARLQNNYVDNHNDQRMIADLVTWKAKVRAFFTDNKDQLPDYSVIDLANFNGRISTFLGIHNGGISAWSTMDAKRKAIEIIENDFVRHSSCKPAEDAAVAACTETGNCS